MSIYIGEFIGTLLLVLLGDGVCCNVSLEKSGFKGGGAVHILRVPESSVTLYLLDT